MIAIMRAAVRRMVRCASVDMDDAMSPARCFLALAAVLGATASGVVLAQTMPGHREGGSTSMPVIQHHSQEMLPMASNHAGMPTMPGQDAFGAVQEIVRILDADPDTDWSKVNLTPLREHLIDMNEVMLKAAVAERPIDGGLEAALTGSGRTLEAIQRMVPAHAQEINGLHGWVAKSSNLPDGVLLTVTSADPKEVAHIRGLGFIGLLASGSHHQPHHLAMVKGEQHIH
jgi:hypothetical protein